LALGNLSLYSTLENFEMKKTLVALAALAAFGAQAQSSVAITGSISAGQSTSVAGVNGYGGWKGDRNALNFVITEDLGNGQKAGAYLQTRFNSVAGGVNTGYVSSADGTSGSTTFEQTKLSLSDAKFGEIAVGRFTNAMGVAPLHPFEDSAQTTSPHQAVNGRLSGQLQYTSPSFMGLQVWGLNAQKSANLYMGSGDGGGYSKTWNLSTATAGSKNFGAYGVNYTNGGLYAQALAYDDLLGVRATKIGASYDLGNRFYGVKLFANQFNQKDNMSAAGASTIVNVTGAAGTAVAAGTTSLAAHKATELAATVPYGAFTFMAGRLTTNTDTQVGIANTKVSKVAWGATYSLSKRTQLQYFASSTDNAGYTSAVNVGGFANGRNQWAGVQHNF
jgi:hypothetical protein